MSNNGGPAFPCIPPCDSHGAIPCGYPFPDNGMTLRDYFAAKALLGILSGPGSRDGVPAKEWFDVPAVAYQIADAMLTALATPPAQPAPATTHGKPDGAMREAVALESRLEQVAKVMRSAWVKDIPMEVWADDLKAVEGAILAVRLDEAAIRKDEREKCLLDLQQSYPDHAWLNAACAAIRNGGKQP